MKKYIHTKHADGIQEGFYNTSTGSYDEHSYVLAEDDKYVIHYSDGTHNDKCFVPDDARYWIVSGIWVEVPLGNIQAVPLSELEELKSLLREFFRILDITEESDNGTLFHPTKISCCRAMTTLELSSVIGKIKQIIGEKE